ncbi:hypothetical protein [Weissella hellenica]|uniref:2-deoxyribose-5-phosphate aldolase n=1 Tax=Weissella hellenica TaxID=46256 RepID=A0A4Y4G057_WEIHE|nr:hypothetical protein [Weissella hellenica]NKY66133.1 2-deoxyribose-5-phosphate aldolase [Weissella hellenica]GED35589.1 deoxyribose-phosphate aldolase [Weissella hellenica]SCB79483.1 deoxyribose-phosphate aldolase [Weissella hellenica]
MDLNHFLEHTTLNRAASKQEVDQVVKEARDNHFYSVVVNSKWVSYVSKQLLLSPVKTICMITTDATNDKIIEVNEAIENGAEELSVLLNIDELKAGHYEIVYAEINALVATAHQAGTLLTVMIATDCLTDKEIVTASQIIADTNADCKKIKIIGNIQNTIEAETMIAIGAERVGANDSMAIIGKA